MTDYLKQWYSANLNILGLRLSVPQALLVSRDVNKYKMSESEKCISWTAGMWSINGASGMLDVPVDTENTEWK